MRDLSGRPPARMRIPVLVLVGCLIGESDDGKGSDAREAGDRQTMRLSNDIAFDADKLLFIC